MLPLSRTSPVATLTPIRQLTIFISPTMASRGKPKKQPTKAAQKALNEKAKKAQEEQAQRAQEILEHQEAVVPAVRELQTRSADIGVGTVYLLNPQDRRSMNQNRRVSPQGARNEVAEAESSRTGM